MPLLDTEGDLEQQTEYAESILASEGFNIKFMILNNDSNIFSAHEYKQYIEKNIDNEAVFIVYDYMFDDSLFNISGDFYDVAAKAAPRYNEKYADILNKDGSLVVMPTQIYNIQVQRMAVLIKNEIYNEYGKEVRTASEYKEFLSYVKDEKISNKPGALALYDIFENTGNFSPMSLFLPEYGYYALDKITTKYGMLQLYTTADNQYYAPYQIPEAKEAILEILNWYEQGLAYPYPNKAHQSAIDSIDINECASILINPMVLENRINLPYGLEALDLTEYTMCVLYPNILPSTSITNRYYSNSGAITGKETDVTQFLEFMEWLEASENYYKFMYGKDGIDYRLIEIDDSNYNGRIRYLNGELNYHNWSYNNTFFYNYENHLLPENLPINYELDMSLISYPYEINISYEDSIDLQKDFSELMQGNPLFNNSFNNVYNSYFAILSSLQYISRESLVKKVDAYFEKGKADDPMAAIRDLVEEYSNNVSE